MKKLFILFFISTLFACQTQKPLYNYGKYEDMSYAYLKKSNEKSTQKLLEEYQKVIKKQNMTRKVPPPGIYADYGFLLIQTNKREEGMKMLNKEIEMYPESKVLIDRVLLMLTK